MLNNRPEAQMYAYPEFVVLELIGLKYNNNLPINIGCKILKKKNTQKKTG